MTLTQEHVDAAMLAAIATPTGPRHVVLAARCLNGAVQVLRLLAANPAFKTDRWVRLSL